MPTQNSIPVESTEFKEIADQISYTKTKRALVPRQFASNDVSRDRDQPVVYKSPSALQVLAYLAIIGLISIILYTVFSKVHVKTKNNSVVDSESTTEIMDDFDLDLAIEDALANNDFRMVIRFQFIKILSELNSNGYIQWRPEKTNRDYSEEVRGQALHSKFQKLANYFEVIWYGKSEMSKKSFEILNSEFQSFRIDE